MYDVSIIIPAWNAAETLTKAVESALQQRNAEVIVVDDGSTDDTYRVAEQAGATKTVRTVHNGVSTARNLGVGLATGTWIQYLDADDWLPPDKCELQIAATGDYDSSWCEVLFTSSGERAAGALTDLLLQGRCHQTGAYIFRRDRLIESGVVWNPEIKMGGLCDYIIDLTVAGLHLVRVEGMHAVWNDRWSRKQLSADRRVAEMTAAVNARKARRLIGPRLVKGKR